MRNGTAELSTNRKGLIQHSAQTPNLVFSNSACTCILFCLSNVESNSHAKVFLGEAIPYPSTNTELLDNGFTDHLMARM